ncbi:MAG TPA: DciA family protein, partial [Gemmatimonadaceae bacterium]|nr:DciA family protein [Gemmatimonadaceae bacterium]
AGFLEQSGLSARVEQARVVPEWEQLVGGQIAAVTEPQSITPDGTLFVAVATHAWMTELSLLEPELLRALNQVPERTPVRRLRWLLRRPDAAPGGRP